MITPHASEPAAAAAGPPPSGTSERVLLLSGSLHAVLTSIFLMLEKLPKEPVIAMGRAAAKPREDTVSEQPVCGVCLWGGGGGTGTRTGRGSCWQ